MQRFDEQEVEIPSGNVFIYGNLLVPQKAIGIVLFAHGSGSGRFSPRNKFVAGILHDASIATLLIDLLTKEEERVDELTREFRFDINLLAERLAFATQFITQNEKMLPLPIGYFGASTGAAAALVAAAELGDEVKAVVSRGGRPDLAGDALQTVNSATLLLVGGEDYQVIDLNEQALARLANTKNKELVIIPGATHLFEEPGTLEEVADYARDWFTKYL